MARIPVGRKPSPPIYWNTCESIMEDKPLTRGWLSAEWKFILSVISPIAAVGISFFALQTKVELIQQKVDIIEGNHLTHIQASMERLSGQMEKLSASEIETKTLLNQHLKQ